MRKIVQGLSFIAFIFIVGGVAVNAQGAGRKYDANIPFDFSIGDKSLPAGKYVIRVRGDANGPGYLELRNEKRELVYHGLAAANGERLNNSANLRFTRISGRSELSMIVSERSGHSILASSRTRLVAASKQPKNQTVNN